MLGNILLEINLANHLNDGIIVFEARKQCLYCVSQLYNYFTCTLCDSDKNSARAKVAGNGKSPEGEGEGGFLGQTITIWMGRYWWILPIYK